MHVGDQAQKGVVSLIQTRLLFPFIHLVCVFAGDWPSSDACVGYLNDWLRGLGGPCQPGLKVSTHLLIVLPSAWAIEPFLQFQCHDNFGRLFCSFEIMYAPENSPRSTSRSGLKKVIERLLVDARAERRRAGVLFRACDLENYFCRAFDAFCRSKDGAFDMVQLAAPQCGNFQDLALHVSHVLGIAARANVPRHSVATLVACALLTDAFPPAGHCKQILNLIKPY
jgi:hypothetical protein